MRQQTQPHAHGLTRIEILAVFVVFIIIFTIVFVGINTNTRRPAAQLTRDSSQLRNISQAFIVFSNDFKSSFPIPSQMTSIMNADANEDYSLNHSANLYSMLIARHYFTPELLISPFEISDYVQEDYDFDYNKYDPENESNWDASFVMHVEDPKIGANASYAHIAAIGDRRDILHTSKDPSGIPILGMRTYDQSILDPSEYMRSPAFRSFNSRAKWVGNIAFADGHVATIETFYPQQTTFDPGSGLVKDNIFAAEFDHPNGKQAAADAFLCISTAATQYTVNDVYDPLLDE